MLPQFVLVPMVYANISSTVYTHVPTLEALRAGTAVRRLFKIRQKAVQWRLVSQATIFDHTLRPSRNVHAGGSLVGMCSNSGVYSLCRHSDLAWNGASHSNAAVADHNRNLAEG